MRKLVDRIIEKLLVILMIIITLNVLWQVFSRYVLNDPSSFTDELARYLLIWIGLMGAAYATGKKLHLSISLIPKKWLNLKTEMLLSRFTSVLVAAFAFLVMGVGGGRLVYLTLYLGQKSPSLGVPLGYVYLAIPLSGVVIIFYSILNLVHPKEVKETQSTTF